VQGNGKEKKPKLDGRGADGNEGHGSRGGEYNQYIRSLLLELPSGEKERKKELHHVKGKKGGKKATSRRPPTLTKRKAVERSFSSKEH